MVSHSLPDGRKVFLTRFAMVRTYEGVLEGSPETASRYILKDCPSRAATLLPPGKPLFVIPRPPFPLPHWFCVAELESPRGVHETHSDYNSRLDVCWFTEDTAHSIDSMVSAILPQVAWDQSAEDYNIMDF